MVVSRSQPLTGDSLVSSAEIMVRKKFVPVRHSLIPCLPTARASTLQLASYQALSREMSLGTRLLYSFDRLQTKPGGVEILEWEQPFMILAKTCLLL